LIVAAVVVLLVVAGVGYWLLRGHGTSEPPAVSVAQSNAAPTAPTIVSPKPPGTASASEPPIVVAQSRPQSVADTSSGLVKGQYGDWQISCDTPPGASFEQCALIQNVTAEDQPNVGLSVIVLKTADQKARLLRVLAPLGVLLPNGLGLNIDGTDMGRVAFVRCLPNGCVAEIVMDDALLKQLGDGKNAIFVVFRTPEEGIGIPVSLKGFADGFKQLP